MIAKSSDGMAKIMDDLSRLAPHIEIAHHIRGRIRLKVLPSGFDLLKDVEIDHLARIPGIGKVKANPLGRSVVIEYDPAKLPEEIWDSFKEGENRRQAVARALQRLLDPA